jgi:hypothetical protein
MNAYYTPGPAAAVVASRMTVLASAEQIEALTRLLEQPAPTALELPSVLSGGDVAQLPDFAAVVADGEDCVVMLRGPYRITCGEHAWSGEETATWREHRLPADPAGEFVVIDSPTNTTHSFFVVGPFSQTTQRTTGDQGKASVVDG